MRDDRVYLQHILNAIEQIEEYLKETDIDLFRATPLLQDGVIRQLEVVGEASRNLSDTLRLAYPDLPWNQIIGMRNRMIHEYFNVDLNIVWEVTQTNLPPLKRRVEEILNTPNPAQKDTPP